MSDDFSNWDKVKTRKIHYCNGCFVEIPKGSTVTYGHGKFEGDMFSCYLCKECDDFLKENSDIMEEGFADGDIGMARKEYAK